MQQDERVPFDRALDAARRSAFPPGEFVGQESFMLASEILGLARQAGVGPGVSVLDLCCGVGGPGRLVTAELGCAYLGVDRSNAAIELARQRAAGLGCRFETGQAPPVPGGPFDVVLLLETLLAFPDKSDLFRGVAEALTPGGRFAFTVEEGRPLTRPERARMPDADTVWLTPLDELLAELERAGLRVQVLADHTGAHHAMARRLTDAYAADAPAITTIIGRRALDELLVAHRLWCDWLGQGRVRKLAMVADRPYGVES